VGTETRMLLLFSFMSGGIRGDLSKTNVFKARFEMKILVVLNLSMAGEYNFI